ncbi:MAG TPA: diguanylate cyclase [Spirochaetota bacterium]|nr:diguanylate cyclase [Spirochaetota bacterium]HOR44953.1 diguanylate cyclase [Spirochaetota bacterium]HPK56939.1 diguanylate cyclase [Spirochaetota bacterium]
MWNMALSLSLVTIASAIAIMMWIMTIARKSGTLIYFAISFSLLSISFALFNTQGFLHPFFGIVLANFLMILSYMFLAWGTRVFYQIRPVLPFRFYVYVVSAVVILSLFTFLFYSYKVRAVTASTCIAIFSTESIFTLIKAGFVSKQIRFKLPIIIIISLFIIFHIVRIIVMIISSDIGSYFMEIHPYTTATFLATQFFTILWAELILLADMEDLLGKVEKKRDQLASIAFNDQLTGINNRYALEGFLDQELERQDRYLEPLSFILFDIDHFKQINDKWGHSAGDEVLINVAHTAQKNLRLTDRIFRWGGEEFLIVCPHTVINGAADFAQKLRHLLSVIDFSESKILPKKFSGITASFGVIERFPGEARNDCFRRVDEAMYFAKKNGRNRVELDRNGKEKKGLINIEWLEEWDSGISQIDQEHRELVQKGNRLMNLAVIQSKKELLCEAMSSLQTYIIKHFRNEEEILKAIKYDKLDEHKRIHKHLEEEARILYEKLEKDPAVSIEIFHFLADQIIVGHLIDYDSDFFPIARGKASDAVLTSKE